MRQLYAAQKIFKITDHYVVTDEYIRLMRTTGFSAKI